MSTEPGIRSRCKDDTLCTLPDGNHAWHFDARDGFVWPNPGFVPPVSTVDRNSTQRIAAVLAKHYEIHARLSGLFCACGASFGSQINRGALRAHVAAAIQAEMQLIEQTRWVVYWDGDPSPCRTEESALELLVRLEKRLGIKGRVERQTRLASTPWRADD